METSLSMGVTSVGHSAGRPAGRPAETLVRFLFGDKLFKFALEIVGSLLDILVVEEDVLDRRADYV
ncbi:hypothetical protein AJ88_23890 [Mesorhizobium amorphae CCBAU 01583]|nr:hypothetical protein AJ88_23890 [Mesorhizobium amorphae CCBAU 01583]